jgi:hypothetical protein
MYDAATLLPNGKLLVAGGYSQDPASAEVYDSVVGYWKETGILRHARYLHTATLLPNGEVLVAGGSDASKSAELYDPASGTWTSTDDLHVGRWGHTSTLLANGKVLVATGGEGFLFDHYGRTLRPGSWHLGIYRQPCDRTRAAHGNLTE